MHTEVVINKKNHTWQQLQWTKTLHLMHNMYYNHSTPYVQDVELKSPRELSGSTLSCKFKLEIQIKKKQTSIYNIETFFWTEKKSTST